MAKTKVTEITKIIFKIIFLAVLGFTISMSVYLTVMYKDGSDYYTVDTKYIDNWTVVDHNGNMTEVGRSYIDERAYNENFIIISKLPEHIGYDSVLCFRNKVDTAVYIDGELRKDFKISRDTVIPGGSVKEFYMTVPLIASDSGKEVRIIRGKTDWNPEVVPETFVTSYKGIYAYMIRKYGVSFALEVSLLIVSILVTLIAFVMRLRRRHSIDLLYGALGILNVACWLIAVSQFTPFITRVYFVDGVMGFMFCMLMPFALIIYLNSIQKNRYVFCYAVIIIVSFVSFVLWTALHFAGLISYQKALVPIDSILGAVVICVLGTLLIDLYKGHIKEYRYTATGLFVFIVMSLIQIVMFLFFEARSNEIPMLIGLMFLLTLMVVQQASDIWSVRSKLENEVKKQNVEKEQMLIHIVKTLAETIDAKDKYTKGHSSRVAEYSREIARRYGYDDSALTDIYMMGLLHDIGKIGIPDSVINKSDKLTDEEFELIKNHPQMGAGILRNIKEMPELAWAARCHHEKYDGTGYPDGFKGEDIPEQARIIAVADAYDAMASYRSYRAPLRQRKVRKEIKNGIGTQFDPKFARIMIEMIDEDKNYDMCEKIEDDE